MLFVLALAIVIAVACAAIARQADPARRAILLRRSSFGLMALTTVVFAAFIIGETFADPGGWKAAGLVAAWAVPLAGLAALSWFRPCWATCVLAVLTATVIGVSIWFALSPQAWRSFEDRNGPVRAVVMPSGRCSACPPGSARLGPGPRRSCWSAWPPPSPACPSSPSPDSRRAATCPGSPWRAVRSAWPQRCSPAAARPEAPGNPQALSPHQPRQPPKAA